MIGGDPHRVFESPGVYSQVRLGVNPEINAASTLLVGLVSVPVLLASWLTGRRRQG